MTDKHVHAKINGSSKASNGASKGPQTPTSPYENPSKDFTSPISANGASKPGLKDGTVRFMLDPQRAKAEKEAVQEYFKVEEEEYEAEVPRVEPPRESRRL